MKNSNWLIAILILIVVLSGAYYIRSNLINIISMSSMGHDMGGMMTGRSGGSEMFSRDINGLSDAKKQEVVNLKDGDKYDMNVSYVKNKLGNKEYRMIAYNGSIPGPLIKVKQGSEITINLKNNIDIPITLHSHGVRLDNAFDGVPDVTQDEIKSGKSFTYKIKFPDEGVYWYHPHMREDYTQELGLYGNFYVEPSDPNYFNNVNKEEFVFLDDLLLDKGGIAPFPKDFTNQALIGRFGNTMFVNGNLQYNLEVNQDDVVRFYFTNSANTRVFNVSIPGVKMKLIGGDSGKFEKEEFIESIIIAPSERYIVEAYFEKEGSYKLIHKTPGKEYLLGNIKVSSKKSDSDFGSDLSNLLVNEEIIKEMEDYKKYYDTKPDKNLRLSLEMMGMNMGGNMQMMGTGENDNDGIEWEDEMPMMNNMATSQNLTWKIRDEDTGLENMDINWRFKLGNKVKIKIFNDPNSMHPMQHPIHFHGQRFLVLKRDGVQEENLVWKDTVLIPTGKTVEILIDMTNPGKWMAHCHIAEHLHSNMMFGYSVN